MKGFTLAEIMISVSIIALLAALAIPNLLRTRLGANENAAIASLKTIATAMENWRAARNGDYSGTSLNALANAVPPYINKVLGTGTKNDYKFTITLKAPLAEKIIAYDCTAASLIYQGTGERSFITDESGMLWGGADIAGAVMADAPADKA